MNRQHHAGPPYSPNHQPHPPYYNRQNYPSILHQPQSPPGLSLASPLPPPPPSLPQFNSAHGAYQSLSSSPTFQPQKHFTAHGVHAMSTPFEQPSSNHAHPSTRQDPQIYSPAPDYNKTTNGVARDSAPAETRPPSQGRTHRSSNPMSFASILGPSTTETPRKDVSEIRNPQSIPPPPLSDSSVRRDTSVLSKMSPAMKINGLIHPHEFERPFSVKQEPRLELKPRHKWSMCERDKFAAALLEIDQATFSDEDNLAGFEEQKRLYAARGNKRARVIEHAERSRKRKRRNYTLGQMLIPVSAHAAEAEARFRQIFEPICAKEIAEKDVEAEKERKKDAQRKRRREAQIRNEELRLADLAKRQQDAQDSDEAEKYGIQIRRTREKLLRSTGAPEGSQQDDMDVQPLAPNLEGGTTSSFHLGSEEPQEPPKKKSKAFNGTGQRPKKSKEKKQAEKDAAEAAYAAGWLEDNHVSTPVPTLAPREDARLNLTANKSRKSERKDSTLPAVNYDSKNFITMLEEINREIAKRNIPKVYRIKQLSHTTRVENMRKTAILASKQAKKWQERTNKSMKDTQARAKRVMREMMIFWKRNEREERDQRRLAEKKEIEDAKKAEADREANRQRRKLNFLISQTELYSHFIGKRIKTDEIERATDDPELAASEKKIEDGDKDAHTINLPPSVADMTGKTRVTNFEDLDFDAEDETALQEAAMANAQKAMDDAQARAREFDADTDTMADMDNSDMNFMNPTMAGDVHVTQPTMLMAQLKEYQLKGLNWLVNLYEQGINGILADEMGLGKTIQSISVMAYLAEKHNVWGPFLVIAPSSTLHNWQQEITRFVPNLKVLPYWGNAKDRKVLRKFWDRKHITYNRESEFHVLVTSYQLVVMDSQYFQKIKWQYMILDEAQAIKSSQSSRWKALLGFNCRNRLLLTGTPIQNNMQELWALLHFIMPTLFDSHDEFSEWFSKDIESHAQSNTKLNQDQLKRLHMILKPFMLRRVKAHVQKELGDKVEKDVFCDLAYRQRAYYANLRSKISIMDLLEKATLDESDQNTATLMNLVMQFRKVCNHPDLFERSDTASPFAMSRFAETASFLREGHFVQVGYSVKNRIQYDLPRMLCDDRGRLDLAGPNNTRSGFMSHCLGQTLNIFSANYIHESDRTDGAFSFLRFIDESASGVEAAAKDDTVTKILRQRLRRQRPLRVHRDEDDNMPLAPPHVMLDIVSNSPRQVLANLDPNSTLARLCNISQTALVDQGYTTFETAALPRATAPPIEISALSQTALNERDNTFFGATIRNSLYPLLESVEQKLLEKDTSPESMPANNLWPAPASQKQRYTSISVPSMRRFVTDSGKLAKLDNLLPQLKVDGHRVLLYFQMTRMIDLMEEYLTYRGYRYVRLDGSTRIEDRRDVVHEFQTNPSIFIFLLSTRAGGLGINLTSADTVIFYDSDWNPTIDSQAMDRAHRLGQTKQVTVYRLITRGTIEERIRKRAMQKEEVQRVVITGGDGSGVDFNTRMPRENRTKDIAMWLADDDQAAELERKEREAEERAARGEEEPKQKKISKKAQAKEAAAQRRAARQMNMEEMYHEGEGNFDDMNSAKASGAATPDIVDEETPKPTKGKTGKKSTGGKSKKAKTAAQRLAIIDASGEMGMGGGEA